MQGRDAFVAGLKTSRIRVFELEKRNPEFTVQHNSLADMSKVLNRIIYEKGGWTLHMLRSRMGTEKFWEGIRNYYRLYRDSNASTGDFRRVMEEASGQDLGWFFTQWLTRTPSPAIVGTWAYNPRTKEVEMDLMQTQTGEAYRLPLEIGLGDRVAKIEMTLRQQRFTIGVEAQPATVVLDPNTLVLMDARLARK